MQSETQRHSSTSPRITYLNKEKRVEELRNAASRALQRMGTIRRIVLFGSLVKGIPTPRSDADLLIELVSSPYPEPRDRIPDLLRALSPLPCPADLFVLTSDEIERFRKNGSPLLRAIDSAKLTLAET